MKPIDTIVNVNYNLYIKKTECKIVKVIEDDYNDNQRDEHVMNEYVKSVDLKIEDSKNIEGRLLENYSAKKPIEQLVSVQVAVRPIIELNISQGN